MMVVMSDLDEEQPIYAVIPAGGSGTRLWPLSRATNPKFLHALTGTSDSLIQATASRVAPMAEPERIFVVTGTAHAATVARQLPAIPFENILVEPSPRDSCAAIGLAASIIFRRDPDAIMGSFAADQLVRDQPSFLRVIRAAVTGAAEGYLMTVGITPTHAETGYGYLQCGEVVGPGPVRTVKEFKEKPSREVAEAYLLEGNYLWNASMFVWKVAVFLDELARQQPALHAGLSTIAEAWGTPSQDAVLGEVWPTLPKISVDHAVMEGAADVGLVSTVPGDFGWHDIGDFHALGEVLVPDADGNAIVAAHPDAEASVVMRDTKNSVVVSASGRLVATVGVHDLIVVETEDAVLVCPRQRSQEVKAIVDELKQRGDARHL
jgi:mannose-1-phosphate guanylyltransferase